MDRQSLRQTLSLLEPAGIIIIIIIIMINIMIIIIIIIMIIMIMIISQFHEDLSLCY